MNTSTDLTSIEVREDYKNLYLGGCVLSALLFCVSLFGKYTEVTFGHSSNEMIISSSTFFAIVAIVFLFLFYDSGKGIVLTIDREGIRGMFYQFQWEDIRYFYTTKSKNRGADVFCFVFKLKDTIENSEAEIKIKLPEVDKKLSEIRKVIEFYSTKYKIDDLGHEDLPYSRLWN